MKERLYQRLGFIYSRLGQCKKGDYNMASVPNISNLLIERERRMMMQFSNSRAMHGAQTFNSLSLIPNDTQTGIQNEGFIFGRDIWGVGKFGSRTSRLASKYGIS